MASDSLLADFNINIMVCLFISILIICVAELPSLKRLLILSHVD